MACLCMTVQSAEMSKNQKIKIPHKDGILIFLCFFLDSVSHLLFLFFHLINLHVFFQSLLSPFGVEPKFQEKFHFKISCTVI
ncbi:hypothetical protein L6452_12995 [Arctium lappa]|uniref:Uncharacterized protein n=1 Tax=Arctium lappa TaxID=4217 RepID=A0ACB9CGZ9_ARCLA|nr:hypothetical protein L6452_12995 [Arctium lappa]